MIIRIIDSINELIGRLISCIAIVFAVIIIYEVFMRYALHQPTRWAFDVSKQLYGFYFLMISCFRHFALG